METLDEIIAQLTKALGSDDDIFKAFYPALKDNVSFPADGFVIGVPVSVIKIDYDGNVKRGLTAVCRREDGTLYTIALTEVVFPKTLAGIEYVAAYRKWLGLESVTGNANIPIKNRPYHKAADGDLDLSRPVELAVLSVKERTARCRLPESGRIITLRAGDLWDVVPGEIVTLQPRKQWEYGGHPYLSGEIQSTRLDVKSLELMPLGLSDIGIWDPMEYFQEEIDEPPEEWEKSVIDRGACPMFEMEQIIPGENVNDFFDDPILKAVELKESGHRADARASLMELCQADLRCLDAHAHLGGLVFDHRPAQAIRHYETGLRIGELSLDDKFPGVMPWSCMGNRPFLRCMHGYGLCLWRLDRFKEAELIFKRMLLLNPLDNQGVRFLIDKVNTGTDWNDFDDV